MARKSRGVWFQFNVSPSKMMAKAMTALSVSLRESIKNYLEAIAPVIVEWMKMNAPWQDRTWDERARDGRVDPNLPNARESLIAEVVKQGAYAYTMTLSYLPHVYYAVYLEYSMQGEYEILAPAYDHWFPIIQAGIVAIVSGAARPDVSQEFDPSVWQDISGRFDTDLLMG